MINPDYLFDSQNMTLVNEIMLENYILQGKLISYNKTFMIVCDKDKEENSLTYNLSLEEIGRIIQNQSMGKIDKGLKLHDFTNPFDDLLRKSQWFARI